MDLDSLLAKTLAALMPSKRKLLTLAIRAFGVIARRTYNADLIALADFAENLDLGFMVVQNLVDIVGPWLPNIQNSSKAAAAMAFGLAVIMGKYVSAEILDVIQCVLVAIISLAAAAILVKWLWENVLRAATTWAIDQFKAAWNKVGELICAAISAFGCLGERLSGLVRC